MADLEKTIKAMEFCNRTDGCNSKCPYYDEEKLDVPCFIKTRFDALELLKEQRWIPVSERLPDEHDTIFAKLKGTDKWNKAMFEKMSDDVRIVEVFEDRTRRVFHSHTIDGKWDIERSNIKRAVTHWMPNPKPPKDGEQDESLRQVQV